jgi:hypothetical protein
MMDRRSFLATSFIVLTAPLAAGARNRPVRTSARAASCTSCALRS